MSNARKKPKTLKAINFELQQIEPLTENQAIAFKSNKNLVLHGLAGTGKTFISTYMAYQEMTNGNFKKVVIIRNAVPTRDQGFLPGNEREKSAVYEAPYIEATNELFQRGDAYEMLKLKRIVHFMTTSFIRGITLRNAVIIVDEIQNMTFHELDSIITRLGENCKIIFCGDFRQTDLNQRKETSGIREFLEILKKLEAFDMIEFGIDDIVRSGLVKDYLIAKDKLGM